MTKLHMVLKIELRTEVSEVVTKVIERHRKSGEYYKEERVTRVSESRRYALLSCGCAQILRRYEVKVAEGALIQCNECSFGGEDKAHRQGVQDAAH